jgi:hypothetical protein
MWMLDYPFPYENEVVSAKYKSLTQSAKNVVLENDSILFKEKLSAYLNERKEFMKMLSEKDYRYISFQLWQEGLARYTELKFAECIRNSYEPGASFIELEDYISPDSFYVDMREKLIYKATNQTLWENKRDCFYTLGALEGLILDVVNPGWKEMYFKKMFFIENYFPENK